MTKEEILTQVRADLSTLKSEFGVNSIGLFGSYATKNNSADSDLDFLVNLNPPYVRHYFDLLFFLEKRFGIRDIISHHFEKLDTDIVYEICPTIFRFLGKKLEHF